MINLFLDTEFTTLDMPWPDLLSIGIATREGPTYYVELPYKAYQLSWFCKKHVVPLLDGNHIEPHVAVLELCKWIEEFEEPCIFVSDHPEIDHALVSRLLNNYNVWPTNLCRDAITLPFKNIEHFQRYKTNKQKLYNSGKYRIHHALDDAKVFILASDT